MDSNMENEFNLEDALLEEAKMAEEELDRDLMGQKEETSESSQEESGELSIEELDQIINVGTNDNQEDAFSLDEFDALLGDSVKEDVIQTSKSASDVFSDSLGAVSSLDDEELEEQFNSLMPDQSKIQEEKKEKSLMQKIFANIEPENPQKEIEKEEQRVAQKEEKKKQKQELKAKKKEEKKKAAAEKKAAKAAAKAAAKEAKAKKKAEIKAKKQQEMEELAKTYVPEGKINKVGATIVFSLAAIIGIVVVGGTYIGAHMIITKNATFDSNIGRYDTAYELLSGIKLKGADKELYEQLQTIMLMNTHQNAYENYRELNMNVEALDSLLKGLKRYDEYYAQAKEQGVGSNYDSMKKQMISELNKTFHVSESEAKQLIEENDPTTYTKALTKICSSIKSETSNKDALVSTNE